MLYFPFTADYPTVKIQIFISHKPIHNLSFNCASPVRSNAHTVKKRKRMEAETTVQPLISMAPAVQNNINAKFIMLDKGRAIVEGNTKTCLSLVADDTAAVHFQMWGDECEAFEPGDILLLSNGIFSSSSSSSSGRSNNNHNHHVLRAGKRGKAEKVGEFAMVFVETPNLSEILWASDPNDSRKVSD
ncbi:hypothetical protein ABFS83_04G022200 [Erythranthe nasuta]